MSKTPILNDDQLSLQMQGVVDIYAEMQQELFDSMIRRLKKRGSADLEANPYVWQLEKLNDMHMINEENIKLISERTGIAVDLLEHVVKNEGLKIYESTREQLLEDLEREEDGEAPRNGVRDALESFSAQANSDLNLINTTLPMSVIGVYKSIVEKAVAQVAAGTKTADKAINDTVMEWTKKGFTGFRDKAGREWRADVYARAVIRTTTYKVYNQMRMQPAEELGIDTFYYSRKATAREACAPLQGQIVTKGSRRVQDGIEVMSLMDYGYGTPGGCLGIHCGHYLTPFIIGVNTLPDVPDHLKDLTPEQAEENARIQAKQRALERAIRSQKEMVHVSKQLGDDDLVMMERLKLRNLQGKIRNLVDSHEFLRRDYSRERFSGNAINKTKTIVEKKHNYLTKQREVKSDIIGVQTKDGLSIKSVSKHLIDRMIGRDVLRESIKEAITNPLYIETDRVDDNGTSRRYIGKEAIVNINPDTGNIITTWKTGSRMRKKYENKRDDN